MSEPKFQKGNKVRCVSVGHSTRLVVGRVYTVEKAITADDVDYVVLAELLAEVPDHNYYADKFEMVQEEKPREFRYLLSDGTPGMKWFASVDEAEDYLLLHAADETAIPIVEIVPVKTVKVRRVVEEVTR
jgi:hypothetical protein